MTTPTRPTRAEELANIRLGVRVEALTADGWSDTCAAAVVARQNMPTTIAPSRWVIREVFPLSDTHVVMPLSSLEGKTG
jgi:hypothetical protein